jgi:hypothetical protein
MCSCDSKREHNLPLGDTVNLTSATCELFNTFLNDEPYNTMVTKDDLQQSKYSLFI